MDHTANTKHIELSDGNWADIVQRAITGADLKFVRRIAHERGFSDETLDGIAIVIPFVQAWSLGDINVDVLEGQSLSDISQLVNAIAPVGNAPSTSSSAGGSQEKGKNRSTGRSRESASSSIAV